MKMRFKRFLSGFMAVATLASVIVQPVMVSASELEPEPTSFEPCCIFAERICVDNEKEILKMEKDTKEKVTADEMMDDLIYLAELIDFMGITSCLAVRGTLSERMTDKLTDSIAGMADEVLEKWEDYQDKTE